MLLPRLGLAASTLCRINRPACLLVHRGAQTKSADPEDDDSKPIALSQSPAASWQAKYSRCLPNERVWYTSQVVSFSVACFLIYFCILREENDIDEMIYRPLPETIKGIDNAFPQFDFNTKPDYVLYHEENKRRKALQSR